ncbi:hypothetical protein QQF64_013937 [Cirrhinus molitorella]|uniref:Uncharacterized protein n=1 Tax=Cirrhinus molitorella TaxID=172907 RepID=A0ABR3LSJ7_9TELE
MRSNRVSYSGTEGELEYLSSRSHAVYERTALLLYADTAVVKFEPDVKMRRSTVIVTHGSGFAKVPLRSRKLCEVSGEEAMQLLSSTQ